jgi:hypothetical protein
LNISLPCRVRIWARRLPPGGRDHSRGGVCGAAVTAQPNGCTI